MIAIKTLRVVHLFSFLLVTSQVLFYLFILSDALKAISLDGFFEQRKAIDTLMIGRFKAMYYSCLVLSILTVLATLRNPGSPFFISSSLALVCLALDLYITTQYSLPLNAIAHTYAPGKEGVEWETLRIQWLTYMKYRGVIITIGMMGLLIGLVFERNQTAGV